MFQKTDQHSSLFMKKILQLLSIFFLMGSTVFAQDYKLPAYQKFTLKNGLTVYLMEQHEVPLIDISFVLPAGAIYDDGKAGLASLTSSSLMHGTKNYSKSQLDETLDFLGASVNTYASKEAAGLSAQSAAKDINQVLAIVKDILTAPTFDTSEFSKEKSRALLSLEQAKERPRAVIGNYFQEMLFGNHVYGNIVPGTVASVSGLTSADIKSFYNEHYHPNGAAIAIVGDFSAKDMKAQLTKLFADWKKGSGKDSDPAATALTKPNSTKVLLVDKDDSHETTFFIGAPGIARNNPDFVAVDVINTLVGGRFTSMLNEALRINSGLTYGAGSRFLPYKKGGAFYISTFTATETTEPAIDTALAVMKRLHTEGISEEMLTSAKNYVKGLFPPDYETSGQLARLLTDMYWYNFDESFINNFQKNVDGLTMEKAKKIIDEYFPADKLQFVLIGKASEIKPIAEKYGPVTEVKIGEQVKKGF